MKNLYIFWFLFTLANVVTTAILSRDMRETGAMCFGALWFIVSYHAAVRLKLFGASS